MIRSSFLTVLLFVVFGGVATAGEVIDIIGGSSDLHSGPDSEYILQASWEVADPFGEFDASLGAAAALNRALGLTFSGHASRAQIEVERKMVDVATTPTPNEYDNVWPTLAPFAVEVLDALQQDFPGAFPEPVELKPFDLAPSVPPVVMRDDPHRVAVRYDGEEYLERLLQRLYFKLIQGPVLITVPYRADAPGVPEEYRDWNNFRYGSDGNTMVWDDTRVVWVDWDLTQTVVLRYENGLIACYDSGKKYYIDHTAAVAAAGAMLAHPDLAGLPTDLALNYVLTSP